MGSHFGKFWIATPDLDEKILATKLYEISAENFGRRVYEFYLDLTISKDFNNDLYPEKSVSKRLAKSVIIFQKADCPSCKWISAECLKHLNDKSKIYRNTWNKIPKLARWEKWNAVFLFLANSLFFYLLFYGIVQMIPMDELLRRGLVVNNILIYSPLGNISCGAVYAGLYGFLAVLFFSNAHVLCDDSWIFGEWILL